MVLLRPPLHRALPHKPATRQAQHLQRREQFQPARQLQAHVLHALNGKGTQREAVRAVGTDTKVVGRVGTQLYPSFRRRARVDGIKCQWRGEGIGADIAGCQLLREQQLDHHVVVLGAACASKLHQAREAG